MCYVFGGGEGWICTGVCGCVGMDGCVYIAVQPFIWSDLLQFICITSS